MNAVSRIEMGEGIRQEETHYVVIVGAGRLDSEALLVTKQVREALRAIDVMALFAPKVGYALYATTGAESFRVLDVRKGRWRVTAPVMAREVA